MKSLALVYPVVAMIASGCSEVPPGTASNVGGTQVAEPLSASAGDVQRGGLERIVVDMRPVPPHEKVVASNNGIDGPAAAQLLRERLDALVRPHVETWDTHDAPKIVIDIDRYEQVFNERKRGYALVRGEVSLQATTGAIHQRLFVARVPIVSRTSGSLRDAMTGALDNFASQIAVWADLQLQP
ncbi:hypothetical protein [Paraburkholderia diazotrophica]|uniref:Lipoprotein n=1 Tax=Paraburkholderia diazotrophica TaxID=667676 RepID=A0A1H6WK08_9BURK|nr:hypothetical protein [Paraburkholderia diazotrophica]SEJ17268.1 hypothetical protein SAMN05192539_1007152 [Paraburkholderia diazotrophica]